MTSRKIVVETRVNKLDIDWDRVYSGFAASGLSVRQFYETHLQSFCHKVSLPSRSSFARHMKLARERCCNRAQQFTHDCAAVETALTKTSITSAKLSSSTTLITLNEQQLALLDGRLANPHVQPQTVAPNYSGTLSVFLPGGLRLEIQIDNPAFFIAQLSHAMKKPPVVEAAS